MNVYEKALLLRNPRWSVIRSRRLIGWFACAPAPTGTTVRDRQFDTHAEAIAYADKEARK